MKGKRQERKMQRKIKVKGDENEKKKKINNDKLNSKQFWMAASLLL